ncbi:MAG: hypothetical protein J6V72_11135 [Kiritimatiellae bacterium]|nr:hypothetical protein [Kiritimatiellia bacterium]
MSSKKKTDAKGKAAKAAKKAPEPENETRRMLTAAEYRALEKAAHALETALRIRRKYQFAVTNANKYVEKNLDKLMRIARGEALD